MRVLLVDDDRNKLAQLHRFLSREFPAATIEEGHSFQSGLKLAMHRSPDILILDMTMPTYDVEGGERGGRERRYAGEEILRRLRRHMKQIAVIVVTQFEQFGEGAELVSLKELKARLAREYSDLYIGAVYYQAADAQWKEDLHRLIMQAADWASRGGIK